MTISPQPGAIHTEAHPSEALIQPLAVEFNGIRYRSALEADWAATFTDLGVYFQYEPEPYRLPSGSVYDCDFYLPNQHAYCEAKGAHNKRIWKPREFAAALEAVEYPRAFLVVILRAAGPRGDAAWESADGRAAPWFAQCDTCRYYSFIDTYDDGTYFCRQCGATGLSLECYRSGLDAGHHVDEYLPMRRAPRYRAA